jgi:two-component system, OmpR family, KDP operon response regulator KdpE
MPSSASEITGSILVVEDDLVTRHYLARTLESHGCRVVEAASGESALQQASSHPPDALILDLGLPDIEGIEVVRRIREWSAMPILILSLRGHDDDKVAALDAGADDYLTKPFSVPELLARLRVALRRVSTETKAKTSLNTFGTVRVDLLKRKVWRGEDEVRLTPIEYNVLAMLVRHAGQVVTQKQLLKEVWGPQYEKETNYLRLYLKQLRDKLEEDPGQPRWLLTEPGVGYRLADE